MTAPAVVTERIERHFEKKIAVAGVDLAVARGEIYGFLGPNGAGKTTLVRMLCTLLRPTRGHARVAGFDVATEPDAVRLRIGVALQNAALDDRQNGIELLRLQARLYGMRGPEIDARVNELVPMIDIGDALNERIGTYSGGMKRRLDLAVALVHEPEVLFLDEPTTGLDPVSRVKVWDEVRRLNRELGMTIFLTTQYLEEADELADRVGIISRGQLVAEGSPSDLKRALGDDVIDVETTIDDPRIAEVLQAIPGVNRVDREDNAWHVRTADGAAAVSPVAVALDQAGIGVRSLKLHTPTLDDVFLELTGSRIGTDEVDNQDTVDGAGPTGSQ